MSIIDLLLETNLEKMKAISKKEYEIKRLSNAIGSKFVVTCHALTNEQVLHISEVSKNDLEMKLNAILETCRLETTRFNDKKLMEKFNATTPVELLNKLFMPGEIRELYTAISSISGYSRDAVKEIKNS